MARKAVIVEEFDDDTDLPLPSQPLPSSGRGPLLQEIDIEDDPEPSQRAGPASPSSQPQLRPDPSGAYRLEPKNSVTDITPYKTYVFFIFLWQSNDMRGPQMDMYLSYIYRRKTSIRHRST